MSLKTAQAGYDSADYIKKSGGYKAAAVQKNGAYAPKTPQAEYADKGGNSRVIGFTTIPYGNTDSNCDMVARYAEESAKDYPVITLQNGADAGADVQSQENQKAETAYTREACLQMIRDKINEMYDKALHDDIEESFAIGANSFTQKEWNKLLAEFDDIQDTIRKLMREEHEKREAKRLEKEILGENALVSEYTKCSYPAQNAGDEKEQYITWYTEKGIFCRRQGASSGYEWALTFDDRQQYDKVMDFLSGFGQDDNLVFASHMNFWQDFLNDRLDVQAFRRFFDETDNGVPNYTVLQGDSVFIDKDKAKWAPYMNSHGAHMLTQEEMAEWRQEL